jgi:hypothetical protein
MWALMKDRQSIGDYLTELRGRVKVAKDVSFHAVSLGTE